MPYRNAVLALACLDPHEKNYRKHPPSQVKRLQKSLEQFGQARSIVVKDLGNGRYTIVAGHGLVQAAQRSGYKEIRADILPVTFTEEQTRAYLVADNFLSSGAQDDEEQLAALLQEQRALGQDLSLLGVEQELLDSLLESTEAEQQPLDFSEREIAVQSRSASGDLWRMGNHVLLCGDSTDLACIKRLFSGVRPTMIWADPPYGVRSVGTHGFVGGGAAYHIPFGGVDAQRAERPQEPSQGYVPPKEEEQPITAKKAFALYQKLWPSVFSVWWGANYYADALPASPFWIVWDKQNNGNFADAELAWCSGKGVVRIVTHMWNGMLKASEQGEKRLHPLQKPVFLVTEICSRFGKTGDILFDPFVGSGISYIGAELLGDGRTVYGCEIVPTYVDITIARWEAHTGGRAEKLR